MTHEEFEKAAQYWNNKEKTVMPQEQLRQAVDAYIKANNTCALATGTGAYVRCTPIEYCFQSSRRKDTASGRQSNYKMRNFT